MGTLFIVGTPIGNLEDITFRAVRTLKEVDVIACEDTRKTRVLLNRYEIKTPTISLYQAKEDRQTPQLIKRLQNGETIALVSDAGMPAISDPGYPLIRAAASEAVDIDVIPGPSAVTTGLLLSGLPTDAFRFYGFLPRKGRAKEAAIEAISESVETCVIFESPKRTKSTIAALAEKAGGNRLAAITRELTKLHQEAIRGTLKDISDQIAARELRGEVTIVISGKEKVEITEQELIELVKAQTEKGLSPKKIAENLSEFGKRNVYQLALKLQA